MGIVIKGALALEGPGEGEERRYELPPSRDIRIEGDRITLVAKDIPAGPGDEVIDASGMAAIPSLANGHAHSAMSLLRGIGEGMELMPWLKEAMWPREARMDDEDIYWGTRLAALEMLSTGTTFCNEMYLHPEALARAAKDSGMRFILSYAFIDGLDEEVGKRQRLACEAFFGKLPDSGPISGFGLSAHSVYATCPDSIRFLGEFSRARNLPFHIHLAETSAEDRDCRALRGMSPAKWLKALGALGPRTILAHCIWLDEEDFDLIAESGAVIVHNPVSNMKLGSGPAFDWKAAASRGIRVILGTDGPASNNSLDLFADMKVAGLLQKQASGDPQRAPVSAIMRAASLAGHEFFGTGGGRIAAGAAADIVLVDLSRPSMVPLHDLCANLVYSGGGAAVDTTICAGKVLVRGGRALGAQEVIAESRRRAAALAKL